MCGLQQQLRIRAVVERVRDNDVVERSLDIQVAGISDMNDRIGIVRRHQWFTTTSDAGGSAATC